MKKSAKNRIIIWSIVSVVLISVLVLGISLSGRFTFGRIQIGSFIIGTDISNFERGNAEFDYSDIKNLHINWSSGSVTIKESTTDKVKIYEDTVSENDRMYYNLTGNGTLEIYDRKDTFTLIGIGLGVNNKNLTVEVPKKAELVDTNVSAASADVEITDCNSQNMTVNTASGTIVLTNVKGTNLEIGTASGTVSTNNCDYTDIESGSVSGSTTIKTYSTCERFEANSVSGEVEVFFENVYNNNKPVDCKLREIGVEAVSGGVTVNLPTNIEGFTAELESVSGAKNIGFNGTQYDDKTVYGNGKTEIDIETVSGKIELKEIEENIKIYE